MNIRGRIFFDVLLFVAALVLPWWVAVPLAILLFFAFDHYYELVLLGLLFDTLYGVGSDRIATVRPVLSMTSILLYIFLGIIKKRLRFNV